MQSPLQEERERSPARLRAEIVERVTWLWRQPFMRAAVFLVAGSNFAATLSPTVRRAPRVEELLSSA